jgi:hypothetical protein
MTFGQALAALMALWGGVGALAFAVLSVLQGYGWQTVAFAGGGTYAILSGWVRLSGRA